MAITDATEFSTFDNDGDTNGSGVITADTFNEWRKKVNGIINKLVEVDNASSLSYQVAILDIASGASVGTGNDKEADIETIKSDIASLVTLDSSGNDFSLDTGTYEIDATINFQLTADSNTSQVDTITLTNIALYNRDSAADEVVNSNSLTMRPGIGYASGSAEQGSSNYATMNLRGVFTVLNAAHQYVLQYDATQIAFVTTVAGGYITLRKLT
jgi:hypothetical protein